MIHTSTVVFDLDGTLVDTAPDLVAALNAILARDGLPPVAYERARTMVGGGARLMIERGFEAAGRTLPVSEVDTLVQDFVAHYAAHISERSRPFAGAEAALDELASEGHRLAICTNKLEWLSRKLLDELGLSQRFAAICGADTFGVSKPSPKPLLATIQQAGGSPQRAVMIGDSITDIATARAASIPVVAVDFGYTETPVSELGPDLIVGAFHQIPTAVANLLRDKTTASSII